MVRVACFLLCTALLVGQEPIQSWQLSAGGRTVPAAHGPYTGTLQGDAVRFADDGVAGIEFRGAGCLALAGPDEAPALPTEALSVEVWALVYEPQEWGGLIGFLQDNGSYEHGWLVGLREDRFCFALATAGADDGDGVITYLSAEQPFETGRWAHVLATYDGSVARLYVDGALSAETRAQSGTISYPPASWYEIGAYHDDNEEYGLRGKIASVAVFDRALPAAEVETRFAAHAERCARPREFRGTPGFVVAPYLQHATATEVRVLFETAQPCRARVRYGRRLPLAREVVSETEDTFHELRLPDLEAGQKWFYQVHLEGGSPFVSELLTFKSAVAPGTPFAFAAFGDSQSNPEVWARLAALAWGERPDFAIHAGDLVGTGGVRQQWVDELLGPAAPLLGRVPLYSVLGNHEQDADNYYRYMANPAPEHRYSFRYGDAEFFMLDSNRDCDTGSEQYRWLEESLAASTALWKFVVHHHPPFTSDSDDYGDSFRGESGQGDRRVRPLVPLYEAYGVDIVFFGHIHTYERSWPLRDGAVDDDGVIYLQIGGAGGYLEEFAPTRSWFTAKLRRTHHFCMLSLAGGTLRLQALDDQGRLFDSLELTKP